MTQRSPIRHFRTSPEIIRLAVMLHVRFPLSLRNVEDRFDAACGVIEGGQILLPREALWLDHLRYELMGFPRARHDDQVNNVSQFLNWVRLHGSRRNQPHERMESIWRR